MNVIFHAITALATASALSRRQNVGKPAQPPSHHSLMLLTTGFGAGILLHGFLDYFPHAYPLKSTWDMVLSLALFVSVIIFAKPEHRPLITVCFSGAIFPDLIDLGPAILNKRLGWSLPVIKIFPWHWARYSGSVYDGSKNIESLFLHLAVIGVSACLLWRYRKEFFATK